MRWPLVSRRAYDLLLDERDRLRAQNDVLVDNRVRVERVRNGMRELPRERKQLVDPEPMPQAVRDMINGFQSGAIRNAVEHQVTAMRVQGTPWPEIEKVMRQQLEEA